MHWLWPIFVINYDPFIWWLFLELGMDSDLRNWNALLQPKLEAKLDFDSNSKEEWIPILIEVIGVGTPIHNKEHFTKIITRNKEKKS